ncbi:MAG: ATP-binding cassette domain-containing protein [Deltaproteobacteria bacterium]|nr:MAG: ATP-binding cassette domain-containing protein [Deltaproteobacteria bacterium]
MRVLARLTSLAGMEWSPVAARTAYAQSCTELSRGCEWYKPLADAAQAVGLRTRTWVGTPREAWQRARDDMPMVARLGEPTSEANWLVIGGRSRGRVLVWEPDIDDVRLRMSKRRFAGRLNAGENEQRTWLIFEPVAPASDLLGPSGAGLSAVSRLWYLMQAERRDIGVVVIYSLGVGVLGLATPVFVQVLVNTVAFGSLALPILFLVLSLFLCLAFAAVLRAMTWYTVEILQRRLFVRMAADLSWRLPRVKVSAFDKKSGPELVNHFFDVLTLQKAASSMLLDALAATMQALVGLILLAIYHPALLGFDVLLVGSIALIFFGLGRRGPETAIKLSKAKYLVAGWLEQLSMRPTIFKLPGGSRLAQDRNDDHAHIYLDAREAHFRIFFRQYVGTLGLQAIAAASLLGLGGMLVVNGQLSLGQLVAAELVVSAVLSAYGKFAEKLETVYDLIAGLDKLGVLVDLPLERSTGATPRSGVGPLPITLHGVTYTFQDGTSVLKGVDLELQAGEKAVIYGADGSGKTVLADILFGLRFPKSGRVSLDGSDLRSLRPESVREIASLVRSEEVFTGTIGENLFLGRAGLSAQWQERVLESVGLISKLESLPRGMETKLNANGAPLSQTQLVRLVIARAAISRPRLLVIDHILDALSERAREPILDLLLAKEAPWTLIVLTQDPELLRDFRSRYQLRGGRVEPIERRPLPSEAS